MSISPKAIIAEDNLLYSFIIKEMLTQIGIETLSEVQTEDELVEMVKCESETVQIILSDVHLKKGSGINARSRIKGFSDIPILLLTGSTPNVIPNLKGTDHLLKPFLFEDLEEKIKSMLIAYQH